MNETPEAPTENPTPDIIGEAAVTAPGRVSFMVRAESADGQDVGFLDTEVSLDEFKAAGWKTDKPLANVGDSAAILSAS